MRAADRRIGVIGIVRAEIHRRGHESLLLFCSKMSECQEFLYEGD
jgi:hypothetical protein